MSIKIVRNNEGNCINFYGSSNPTYWNACLSGEVDATDNTLVNVKNDIKTAEAGVTQYEFFRIPYTEFLDEDNQPFANASDVAAYITLKGNVTIGTGVTYKGIWNPDTNTPDITTDTSGFNSGDFYKIIASGTHDLGSGAVDFINGDEVIFDGTVWERKPFAGALIEYDTSSVLLNNNAAVYADGAQGLAEPQNIEQGWYFTNDEAGKKINWYFVGSQNVAYQITKATLKNSYARVKMLKTTGDIFFAVYTAPQYDGYDQFWFRSRYVYAGGDFSGISADQEIIIYWGEEPTDHPTLTRVQLTLDANSSLISTHPDITNDAIFSVALSTNSSETVGNNEFIVKNLGYKNEQYTQDYVLESTLESAVVSDDSYKDLTGLTSDFKLDDTSTTIMLDNGYNFGANTIKAVNTGDGLITIQSIQGGITHFYSLDHTNVTVNGQSVSGGLNDVINTLNELFTVGAFESVIISDPYSTMVADVGGTDTTTSIIGSGLDPIGDDVYGSSASGSLNGYKTTETISKAGEYFSFDIRVESQIGFGLIHSQASYDAGYYSGSSTYANPTTFGTSNSAHYGFQFSHWFHPSPDGPWTNYGANTSYVQGAGWTNSGGLGFRYSAEGADWIAGNPVKMRVGIDNNGFITVDYWDSSESSWVVCARTSYSLPEGAEFHLGIKTGDTNGRVSSLPKVHLLPVEAPTLYFRYVESPDGYYSYPLFATQEEANYYYVQSGGTETDPNLQSHTHIYEDDPTFTTWYMPHAYNQMNYGLTPIEDGLTTFEGQTINWTEITTLTNAQMIPVAFSDTTITVDELSAVNIQLHPQDASYVTSIIDTDNSGLTIDVNGVHLNGTAPEVTDDNVVNPSDTYSIEVVRTNNYGSSSGTLTLVVNNLTAPAETIDGFQQHTGSLSGGLMQDGSVYQLQHQGQDLVDGKRLVIPKQWVADNVLPYLLGAGDTYIAGWLNGTHDTSTLETSDFDFAIVWEYIDANQHRVKFLRDGGVLNGGGTAGVISKLFYVNSMTNAVYDFAIELDGTSAWLIACNVNSINTEASPNDGGQFSHYAEVTNYDTGHTGIHFGVISMEGGLSEGTAVLSTIDTPTPTPTNSTSWTKAIDFSGGSEHLLQNTTNNYYHPISMAGTSGSFIAAPVSGQTTTNGYPWATSVVFQIDGNSSNQHIWNYGEGAGSTDDNIYLRVDASRNLYFGWGRDGALNELFFGSLNTGTWYGCYIGYNGTKLSGTDATPANLADVFEVRLFSDATVWQISSAPDSSTSTMWGLTQSTTGARMDRSFIGNMTIGGRGTNRNFHGKVAAMVVTTLRNGQSMPDTTEIKMMVTDPIGWVDSYKVNQPFRRSSSIGDYTSNFAIAGGAAAGATQVWLMGDRQGDAYPIIKSYTNENASTSGVSVRMEMQGQVSNDIENVTINMP